MHINQYHVEFRKMPLQIAVDHRPELEHKKIENTAKRV